MSHSEQVIGIQVSHIGYSVVIGDGLLKGSGVQVDKLFLVMITGFNTVV